MSVMGADPELVRPLHSWWRQAGCTILMMILWLTALKIVFELFGDTRNPSADAVIPLIGLAVMTWPVAKFFMDKWDYMWPATMLGLLGPICFGFAVAFSTEDLRALPPDQAMAVVAGAASIGMLVYCVRFTLAGLVSPIVTFAIVSVFLLIKGMSREALYSVEGFSPRGLLAGLIDHPLAALGAGIVAFIAVVVARWLELNGRAFGVESARPLHLIGGGIVALVAGRFALMLPAPLDKLALVALFLVVIVWALRIERIAVMLTCHVALVAPIMLTIFGGRVPSEQILCVAAAVVGTGMVIWGRGRRYSVALGWTRQPRHIRRNWPERVIWPYNPEIHK